MGRVFHTPSGESSSYSSGLTHIVSIPCNKVVSWERYKRKPEVGLDDFLTGNVPGSDGFDQLQGAHAPEVDSRDAHVYTPLYGWLRSR
jgi:hypothetical protein